MFPLRHAYACWDVPQASDAVEKAFDTPIVKSFTVKWLVLLLLATPVQTSAIGLLRTMDCRSGIFSRPSPPGLPGVHCAHSSPFLTLSPALRLLCRLGGRRYYAGALSSLRHGFANMDVLVAGGTTIAYVYSLIASIIRMTCTPPAAQPR